MNYNKLCINILVHLQHIFLSGIIKIILFHSENVSRRTVSKRSISLERDSTRSRGPRDASLDNLDKSQHKVPPFLLLSQVN